LYGNCNSGENAEDDLVMRTKRYGTWPPANSKEGNPFCPLDGCTNVLFEAGGADTCGAFQPEVQSFGYRDPARRNGTISRQFEESFFLFPSQRLRLFGSSTSQSKRGLSRLLSNMSFRPRTVMINDRASLGASAAVKAEKDKTANCDMGYVVPGIPRLS